jgi:hypothetical protein
MFEPRNSLSAREANREIASEYLTTSHVFRVLNTKAIIGHAKLHKHIPCSREARAPSHSNYTETKENQVSTRESHRYDSTCGCRKQVQKLKTNKQTNNNTNHYAPQRASVESWHLSKTVDITILQRVSVGIPLKGTRSRDLCQWKTENTTQMTARLSKPSAYRHREKREMYPHTHTPRPTDPHSQTHANIHSHKNKQTRTHTQSYKFSGQHTTRKTRERKHKPNSSRRSNTL